MFRVQSGLDVFHRRAHSSLRGKRVGVLCHQASVTSTLRPIVPLLLDLKVSVTALFAPEHGLWGTAQDQIPIEDVIPAIRKPESSVVPQTLDPGLLPAGVTTKIPVFSLYGDHRAPSLNQLEGIDVLVCDLQDVGSRYYTFVWTMALALQMCAKAEKTFIVLDRPNPLGGDVMEGPLLDMNFASYVGLYPTPVRHGLTIGEMALWLNARFEIGAELEVIAMKGWKRSMYFENTGLPWVLPSPNMPTVDTAVVYPGGCLLEGTALSEGRGTTRPFELFGAPYIDGDVLAAALNAKKLPGVLFRAARFEPTFHKFEKQVCGGVQVHVTDRKRFKAFLTYAIAIEQVRSLYPDLFAWRNPPYEYELEKWPIDILCGTDAIRKVIETDLPLAPLEKDWAKDLAAFRDERRKFLLYN